MKKVVLLILGMGAVALLGLATLLFLAWWDLHPRRCVIEASTDAILTEQEATDLSRRALVKKGLSSPALHPKPYRHNSPKVFARNTIHTNHGYVIWGDTNHYRYSVHMEKSGTTVRCSIAKCK